MRCNLSTGRRPEQATLSSVDALQRAVVCRGLTKEFGDGDSKVMALRGVDMDVSAGQMTLLVGPSGCGKTTLISIIAGLLDPTDGAAERAGAGPAQAQGDAAGRLPRQEHRLRLPAVQPAAGADGGRERGRAAA